MIGRRACLLIKAEVLQEIIESYHFTGGTLVETIVSTLQRKTVFKRVTEKLMSQVRMFYDNMGDVWSSFDYAAVVTMWLHCKSSKFDKLAGDW